MRRITRSIIFLCVGFAGACNSKDKGGGPLAPDPTPQITSVSPDPMVEGQTATLTGTDFSSNAASNTVTMDDVSLVVNTASVTSLTVRIPVECRPLRNVMLRVSVGGNVSDAVGATVAPSPTPGPCGNPMPQISSVSPGTMVEGQNAILTGTDFSPNIAWNTVTIDDVMLLVTQASETSLSVTLPEGCGPLRSASLQVRIGDSVSSPFSVTVAPDPTGPGLTNVSLTPGSQVVYRGPRHCLNLPTNGGSAQYLLGIQSTGRDGNATQQITVGGTGTGPVVAPRLQAASAGSAAARVSPAQNFRTSPASAILQRHRGAHDALMADLISPVRNPNRRSGALAPRRAPSRAVVTGTEVVGQRLDLRVRTLGDDCSLASTKTVTAELRVKTPSSMWWVDVANPTVDLLDDSIQALSSLFDNKIVATETAEFGASTDIDGNARINILITQAINADTTSGGQTLGFVNPCDFFDRDDASDFVATNEGEFFYSIAPDPSGSAGDALPLGDWMDVMPIIIAHEFAHIIQVGRRVASPTAIDFMGAFVAEGQATLAEEVVGHAMLGNGTWQNLSGNVAFNFPPEDQLNPWYSAAFGDLVFYFGWPGSPDDPRIEGTPQECTWVDADVEHPCGGRPLWYGVTWSFLRWASDLYGPALGGEAAFQTALIDGDLSGFDNLEEALAGQGTLEDHLANWAAALYMDGRPNASAKNSLSSWNLFDVSKEVGIHFAPVTATGCVHRPGAGGRGQRPSGRPAERGGRRAARGPSRSVD